MSCDVDRIKKIIRAIIADSRVPEDAAHAENVLKWVHIFCGNPDEAMIFAALAHDIDRADKGTKARRSDFNNYDDFKAAHAANSAEILGNILRKCGADPVMTDKACTLVRMHETGGCPEADILKNADSLSFFEVNLPYYFKREGYDETLRRCVWGYMRLYPELRQVCASFSYSDTALNLLMADMVILSQSAKK